MCSQPFFSIINFHHLDSLQLFHRFAIRIFCFPPQILKKFLAQKQQNPVSKEMQVTLDLNRFDI